MEFPGSVLRLASDVDLFRLTLTSDWRLMAETPVWLLAVLGAVALGIAFPKLIGFLRAYQADEVEISFLGGGKVKIKPNHDTIRIAHRAWVELATRRAGTPFDADYDVITEIYDSWYDLFGVMRELAKQVPAERIRTDEDVRKTIGLIVAVLNRGLRPHLTRWQAEFRRWYEAAVQDDSNAGKPPQIIQRLYPRYEDLVADLRATNAMLIEYMTALSKLAAGGEASDLTNPSEAR